MKIPNSPEELFNAVAEPLLTEMFPNFANTPPRLQRLVQLIHTELVKGELNDVYFQEFLEFYLRFWYLLNKSFMARVTAQIMDENDDEIDTDWVDHAMYLKATDQYLLSQMACADTSPTNLDESGHYSLQPFRIGR